MDKDRIKGAAEQVKGKVKEQAGKLTGDKKLETEGKIDKAAGKVHEERLDDRGNEFPRVNETLLMSQHRYGYAVEAVNTKKAFDTAALLKHDLRAGTTEQHKFAGGGQPGEFVFVPADGATSEDDGYLMGYVYDPTRDSSNFVVLNAHDITADPIASVRLPQRVPFGFHGNWVAD